MLEYEFVTNAERLGEIARQVVQAPVIGLDIETTNVLDPQDGEIRLVQLIFPGKENNGYGKIYVIDLFETKGLGPVRQAMFDTKAIWVVHNAKFEQKWFWWHHRLKLWPVFCTYRASVIINNGYKVGKHTLDDIVFRELQERPVNVGQGKSDWTKSLTKRQKDYAAEDVLRLLRLREVLKEKLARYGLLKVAAIEFGVVLPEGRTELNGFPLDKQSWLELAEKNKVERVRLREEVLKTLPPPTEQGAFPGMVPSWNIDSPQQVLASVHKYRLKALREIKSTGKIALAPYAANKPGIRNLLVYRNAAQRVKSFGEKYIRHIRPDTGRVHTDYYGLLLTGRYASNKPNLQQIPRDKAFRACFRAPDGRMFVLADYAGIEMCLCAEISGDIELIKVFVNGDDAHRTTASIIMEKQPAEVQPDERQQAKPVNFGLIYGMMEEKLVLYAQANYGVVMSLSDARKYRERYFERYQGIAAWHERALRNGQREGFARTLAGRIRYMDPTESHNEFYNTPVQGSGADALKSSMRIVQDRIDKTFGVTPPKQPDGPVMMVHHVHDEIILETDDDKEMIEESEKQLHDGMREGMVQFLKKVPTVVDPSHGKTWADAK